MVIPKWFYSSDGWVWALARMLEKKGNEIRVAISGKDEGLRPIGDGIKVKIGERDVSLKIKGTFREGILVYCAEGSFDEETDEGFILFSQGILRFLRIIDWKPDVIHCNDWQSGLFPLYLNTIYRDDPFYQNSATLFTIYDLREQGLFLEKRFWFTGIDDSQLLQGLRIGEYYSFTRCGILFADLVNTVSKGYAEEIKGREILCGKDLHWVFHGLDYEAWNPKEDRYIYKGYDSRRPMRKRANKNRLMKEYGLKGEGLPLLGMVSRRLDKIGLELVSSSMDELMEYGLSMIILGEGNGGVLSGLEERYKARLRVNLTYEEGSARKVYAGSDILLLPSMYEPWGYEGMIGLRYGTPPIVMATGGLKDLVREFNPTTLKGNGFIFYEYDKESFIDAVGRAIFFYKDKGLWQRLMKNGMEMDLSLETTSDGYIRLYKEATKRHLIM